MKRKRRIANAKRLFCFIPYYRRLRFIRGLRCTVPKLKALVIQWNPGQTLEDYVHLNHALGQIVDIQLKPR